MQKRRWLLRAVPSEHNESHKPELSWLWEAATVREIRCIADTFNPLLLFLSETKMRSQRADELRWRLGFQNAFGVSSVGLSGGLVLLWKNNVTVDLKSYSKFHIDVWVTMENGRQWRFTGFYGEPVRARRKESWRLLRFLRNQTDLPWLCVGDFNEVLHEDEQMGGNDREEWCMEGFREAVDYCSFSDLGFRGLPYTWDNRREGSRNIKVRLDRGLADAAWLDLFGGSLVTHVQTAESDHCAILV